MNIHIRRILTILYCFVMVLSSTGAVGAASLPVGQISPVKSAILLGLMDKAQQEGSVRVIVQLDTPTYPEGILADELSVQEQRSAIESSQMNLLAQVDGYEPDSVKPFTTIPFIAMSVDREALAELAQRADVISIEEDVPVPADLAESVPLINAPAAWTAGYTGSGQTIAILDTGVDKNHSFLSGKVVSEACYSTNYTSDYDTVTSICPAGVTESTAVGSAMPYSGVCPSGSCDHGTHVAGIAAGKNESGGIYGVAKEANLIAIQVFSRFATCNGAGYVCALSYQSDQIRGLERVYALRSTYAIAAVNMSLGGGKYSDQANCDSVNAGIKAAIDNLRSVGIATVIASGNSYYSDGIGSPGCVSSAVSVGSTGDGSEGTVTNSVSDFSNSVSFLNLLAPGAMINSSIPNNAYASWNGTSMATPHVAGAWAVLKQLKPAASVDQILGVLTKTGVAVTDSRNGITKPRIDVGAAAVYLRDTTFYTIAGTAGMQGVTVLFADGSSDAQYSALTDSDGTYSLEVPANSAGTLTTAPKRGYSFSPASYTIATLTGNVSGKNFTATALAAVAAPSNLSASLISSSKVRLTWTDNASDEDDFQLIVNDVPDNSITINKDQTSVDYDVNCGSGFVFNLRAHRHIDGSYSDPSNTTTLITTSACSKPANDDFNTPTLITSLPLSATQQTGAATSATDDPVLSCSDCTLGGTVWYKFDSPTTRPVTIDTTGSNFNTVLAVWTGTRGSLSNIGFDDDGNGVFHGTSKLDLTFTAGTTYYIEIGAYDYGLGGTLHLNMTGGNQWPSDITLSPSRVMENLPIGTTVGTLSTTDADNSSFTYSLVSGAGDTDNASFTLSGNTLSTAAVFDLETKGSYSIRVKTDDGSGGTFEKVLTITILLETHTVSGSISPAGKMARVTYTASGVTYTGVIAAGGASYTIEGIPVGSIGNLVATAVAHYSVESPLGGYSDVLVNTDLTGKNFTFTIDLHRIRGAINPPGSVTAIVYTVGGTPYNAVIAADGTSYTISGVPYGSSGNLTATAAALYSISEPDKYLNLVTDGDQVGIDIHARLNQYSIQGTILAGTTGLAGAKVSFGNYEATSAGNGSFTITNIPPGSSEILSAAKVGYTLTYAGGKTFPLTITEDWGGQNFNATLALCSISGSVLNGTAGVSGVQVQFAGAKTNTNATGAYTLVNIPCGTEGTLSAGKAGVALSYTGSRTYPVKLDGNWTNENFTAQASYRINGNVIVGGGGVAGVTVTFDASAAGIPDLSAVTGSRGEYVLDVPVNSLGTLKAGFGLVALDYTASGANLKTFPAEVSANWTGQNFGLPGKKMISGTVSFQGTGLRDATITFDDADSTTNYPITSAANGRYVLFVPENLSGTLSVTDTEHEFMYSATGANIKLFPAKLSANWNGQNFTAFRKTHGIRGRVTMSGGSGLPDAQLLFVDQDLNEYSAGTVEDGNYILGGIPDNSTGVLAAYLDGFTFASLPVTLPITGNLSGQNFVAGSTADDAILHAPYGDTAAADTAFTWEDTGNTARYNLLVEYDANGVWQPLGDFWYETANICSAGECRVTPFKALTPRYYRWTVRGDGAPDWSPVLAFQVKKVGYSPQGTLEKPLGENVPLMFRWVPWQQKVNKVLTDVMYYRVGLYYGKTPVYDAPAAWYEAGEICTVEECSLTLDFSPDQLGYGAYTWKVQGRNDYTSGTPPVGKRQLSAQLLGGTFSYGPAAVEGMSASGSSVTSTMGAQAIITLSAPTFTWKWSSDVDSYLITVEKQDGFSGVWKKYKQSAFPQSKKVIVKGVTIFECSDTSSPADGVLDTCTYNPGGLWPEAYYRWSVQGRNYSQVGKSKVYGNGPLAMSAFTLGSPLVTPQPISPVGALAKPEAGQQIFRWEESQYAEAYVLAITGAKKLTLTIQSGNANLSCANQICTYLLNSTATPAEVLDYGNYSYSLQSKKVDTVNGKEMTTLSKASAGVKFSYGPAKPSGLSPANGSSAADTTPDFSWGVVSGAGKYNLRLLKQAGTSWAQVAAMAGLAASKYCVGGTTCTFPYTKALPSGITYKWEIAGVSANGGAGPAATAQFTITP